MRAHSIKQTSVLGVLDSLRRSALPSVFLRQSRPNRPRPEPAAAAGDGALFTAFVPVLRHPRCMNCHSKGDFPRQGDDGHPHTMNVRRGPAGMGVTAEKCSTCHQDHNLAGAHLPPGAPALASAAPKHADDLGGPDRRPTLRIDQRPETKSRTESRPTGRAPHRRQTCDVGMESRRRTHARPNPARRILRQGKAVAGRGSAVPLKHGMASGGRSGRQ